MHDPERRAHQTLPRQRRALPRACALPAALIQHARQTHKDLLAALKDPRAGTQRLHHTHPRERRLTIEKRQDHPQAATHPLTPRQPLKTRRPELPLHHPQNILKERRQTRLTAIEELIERAPRNPRTRSDIRDRRTRIPKLLDRADRTRQQPRTLNLSDLHRRPPPTHLCGAPRNTPTGAPGRGRTSPHTRHYTTPPTLNIGRPTGDAARRTARATLRATRSTGSCARKDARRAPPPTGKTTWPARPGRRERLAA